MANEQTISASPTEAFSLTKWYFDCTSEDGRTTVGYCAGLVWAGVSLTWQALTMWKDGQLIVERSTLSRSPMPRRDRNRITWEAPGLGCNFAVEAISDPLHIRLFEQAGGSLEWRCEAPSADVIVSVEERPCTKGIGYVECIELTIPPWRLPIRELRWGRWIDDCAAHAVVWIDWRGPEPRTWMLVDGVVTTAADVQDASVATGRTVLTLEPQSTLSARSLAEILGRFPLLRAIVPGSLMGLRQIKWQSRGALRRDDSIGLRGTAIHERVVFHEGRDDVPRA